MRRYELTDEQWDLVTELFPAERGKGRPYRSHRMVLDGIMWILNTGSPWRDLPERYGRWKTVYNRFNRWRREGLFDRVLQRLQIRLDEQGRIDWDLWCVDGSSVRAHAAAAGGGKKGVPKSPKTTHWAAREAGLGPKSMWLLTVKALP